MPGIDVKKDKKSKFSRFLQFLFIFRPTIERIRRLECKNPYTTGKRVASVSFRQEIKTFCTKTMPQIDPEIVEKFHVFVVFDAISVQFPRDFVICSNTINNEKLSYAAHFLERTLQRFVSTTL